MIADFGARRGLSGLGLAQVSGMALMIAGLASIPGYIVLETWMNLRSMQRDWAVKGPPCPEVETPSRYMLGKKPLKVFTYGGVRFARKVGHVDCAAFPEPSLPWEKTVNYRVCQFTGPGLVGVTLDGKTTWFQPGWGRPTTVTIRHGRASCVVAGWFRG